MARVWLALHEEFSSTWPHGLHDGTSYFTQRPDGYRPCGPTSTRSFSRCFICAPCTMSYRLPAGTGLCVCFSCLTRDRLRALLIIVITGTTLPLPCPALTQALHYDSHCGFLVQDGYRKHLPSWPS